MNRAISRRGMRKTECETRSCPTDPADTNFDLVKMVNVRDIEEDTQLEKLSVVETNSIGSVPNDGPGSPESRNLSPVEICPTTPESRRGHRHLAIVTPPPCAKGGSGEEEERERQSVRVEVDDGDDQDVTAPYRLAGDGARTPRKVESNPEEGTGKDGGEVLAKVPKKQPDRDEGAKTGKGVAPVEVRDEPGDDPDETVPIPAPGTPRKSGSFSTTPQPRAPAKPKTPIGGLTGLRLGGDSNSAVKLSSESKSKPNELASDFRGEGKGSSRVRDKGVAKTLKLRQRRRGGKTKNGVAPPPAQVPDETLEGRDETALEAASGKLEKPSSRGGTSRPRTLAKQPKGPSRPRTLAKQPKGPSRPRTLAKQPKGPSVIPADPCPGKDANDSSLDTGKDKSQPEEPAKVLDEEGAQTSRVRDKSVTKAHEVEPERNEKTKAGVPPVEVPPDDTEESPRETVPDPAHGTPRKPKAASGDAAETCLDEEADGSDPKLGEDKLQAAEGLGVEASSVVAAEQSLGEGSNDAKPAPHEDEPPPDESESAPGPPVRRSLRLRGRTPADSGPPAELRPGEDADTMPPPPPVSPRNQSSRKIRGPRTPARPKTPVRPKTPSGGLTQDRLGEDNTSLTPRKNKSRVNRTLDMTPTKKARNRAPPPLSFKDRIAVPASVSRVYGLVQKATGSVGGNGSDGAIYGELTVGCMQKVVNILKEKTGFDENSSFIDVGSGLGKPNFHVAQDPGCEISYGLELEEIRWKLSMVNHRRVLLDEGLEGVGMKKHNLFFAHGDILSAKTFDPFTHVYMFDIGFPPSTLQQIAKIFNASKARHLISYQKPHKVMEEYGFEVDEVLKLPLSLTVSHEGHMMYLYRRKQVPEGLKIERISEVDPIFATGVRLCREGGNGSELEGYVEARFREHTSGGVLTRRAARKAAMT